MSGARLRIIRAKAQRRGWPWDWFRAKADPIWAVDAFDTSGFENTCPLGVDEGGNYTVEQCKGREEGYRCKVCVPALGDWTEVPNEPKAIDAPSRKSIRGPRS